MTKSTLSLAALAAAILRSRSISGSDTAISSEPPSPAYYSNCFLPTHQPFGRVPKRHIKREQRAALKARNVKRHKAALKAKRHRAPTH